MSSALVAEPRRCVLLPLVAIASVASANGGYFPTSFGWTALVFAWVAVIALYLVAPAVGDVRPRLAGRRGRPLRLHLCLGGVGGIGRRCRSGRRARARLPHGRRRRADHSAARRFQSLARRARARCRRRLRLLARDSPVPDAISAGSTPRTTGSSSRRLLERSRDLRGDCAAARVWLRRVRSHPVASRLFGGCDGRARADDVLHVQPGRPVRGRGRHRGDVRAESGAAAPGGARSSSAGLRPARCGLARVARDRADAPKSATLAEASHDGRRLALELALLAVVQAALALGYVFAAQRVRVPSLWRRAFGAAIAVAIVACLVGAVEKYGSPSTMAHRAYHSFLGVPPDSGSNLNGRLLSFSNNGRIVLWHSAWKEFLAHPIVARARVASRVGGSRTEPPRISSRTRTTSTCRRSASSARSGSDLLALFLGVPLVGRRSRTPASARGAGLRRLCRVSRARRGRLGLADAGGHAARPVRRSDDRCCRAQRRAGTAADGQAGPDLARCRGGSSGSSSRSGR